MHKSRATGAKKKAWRKKRKYELGRQPANTKMSSNKTVRRIRVRGGNEGETVTEEVVKKSNHVLRKLLKRQENRISLDPHIDEQFSSGRLLARITSRPGQCGRADGCILEGNELEFYMKKIQRKKGKGAA
ncbi:hypothetical protein V6N11_020800 [Hibiscus sabdariffa]|uniref:40S ribosomal protein S8 n=1 Tax=Hibiscus sabdariffa TaxID=183260 RepID=A0ABR2Q9J0_9ROSI